MYLQVEAGDIILRVNDTDVSRLTTKEGECSLEKPSLVLLCRSTFVQSILTPI